MNASNNKCLLVLMAILSTAASLQAQATRTWVSGVGDDANPCSRTAPCKTFAGAISKTAAGGEISVLDPGGFGVLTITKAITINGGGMLASILGSSANGVIVNAGVNDTVTIRGVYLNGAGSGLNGIRYLAGKALVIDNCVIEGFTLNSIDVALTVAGRLTVKRSTISGGTNGVRVAGGTGRVTAVLSDVTIQGASSSGVDSLYGSTEVVRSVIAHNAAYGLFAEGGTISVDSTLIAGNATAAQAQSGATIRISDCDIYDNLTGLACGAGTVASTGNNRKGGNVGGTGLVCPPNGTIQIQ
jgi:hypothetical protein